MTSPSRSRSIASLLALLVLLLGGLGACGDGAGFGVAAAEVNGRSIPQSALEDELEAMRDNQAYLEFLQSQGNRVFGAGSGTFDAGFVRRVLTRQIYLELVHQAFEDNDLQLTSRDFDQVRSDVANEVGGPDVFEQFDDEYRTTLLRRSAEVLALQAELSGADIDEQAIRTFYEENQELFVETCVRHILFAVLDGSGQVDQEATEAQASQLQSEAAAAKARVAAGEDFAAVAVELSDDPSNRDQGGDLGCGGPGRFVPEFEEAMDALQPGQVSDPVQTQFGFHLVNVTSREAQPFDEVAEQIRERLLAEASQGFGTFLNEQLTSAEIEVNPRYGTFSKNPQSPGIVAPNTPTTEPVGGADGGIQSPIDLGG